MVQHMVDNARVTHEFMNVVRNSPNFKELDSMHLESLHMILHKISRILCGDPNYSDNAHDIVGYAKLLEDYQINKEELKEEKKEFNNMIQNIVKRNIELPDMIFFDESAEVTEAAFKNAAKHFKYVNVEIPRNTLEKWHDRFLNIAEDVAEWSKDPRTQVGAVIVSPDRKHFTIGYNGFPEGISDNERLHAENKNDFMIHAEVNALINAQQNVKGWSLYCTKFPCHTCTLQIIQSGVTEVVAIYETDTSARWYESQEKAIKLFNEKGVKVLKVIK